MPRLRGQQKYPQMLFLIEMFVSFPHLLLRCSSNVVWSSTPTDNWLPPAAAFLNMLCSLKYGIYIFFGVWQFIAIFFTYFLVPETRGVPIEEVSLVASCTDWQPHLVACCSICSLPCDTVQGTATLNCWQRHVLTHSLILLLHAVPSAHCPVTLCKAQQS